MEATDSLLARACISCPSEPPQCTKCPSDQVCTLTVQTCQRCPEAKCVRNQQQHSDHSGAIAGGVVGGLVGLGFIIGGFLWYKYRHRRLRHLQQLRQQVTELTPPDSPDYDEDVPEFKAESMSPHGEVMPIEIHFNPSPFESYASGPPTIRESIRDSEYSFGSENPENNNRGLRNYDVAVQGRAALVDLNRARQLQRQRPLPSGLAQGQLYDIVEHSESTFFQQDRSSRRPSSGAARPPASRPVSRIESSRPNSLRPDPSRPESLAAKYTVSGTAGAPPPPPPNRFSRASSREYVADLPDEVRLYNSHGLLDGED